MSVSEYERLFAAMEETAANWRATRSLLTSHWIACAAHLELVLTYTSDDVEHAAKLASARLALEGLEKAKEVESEACEIARDAMRAWTRVRDAQTGEPQ